MLTSPTSTTTERRSARIRAASMAGHQSAAHGSFSARLAAGDITEDEYRRLLNSLVPVYQALESSAEHLRDDPLVAPFLDRRLHRTPSLLRDVRALNGGGEPVGFATQRYVARILSTARQDPVLYLAHHYTRYLGDLSGGQVIARRLAERTALAPDRGLSWYDFTQLSDPTAFKGRYRQLLDELPISRDHEARMIDEIVLAYQMNTQLLGELETGNDE